MSTPPRTWFRKRSFALRGISTVFAEGTGGRVWRLSSRTSFDCLLAKRRSNVAARLRRRRLLTRDQGDESTNPELLTVRKFDQARVRQALGELPPEYREIIVLRELEGLSYKEIAAVTDLPIGTVMSRLSRARGQLQLRLAPSPQEEA